MRAIVYTGAGGPEVLAVRDDPVPEPEPGQVLVRIRAAGLNRADVLQRRGSYPAPPGWPADIPGLEYAGEVARLGPGVTRWKTGEGVMGLVGGGAHAEYVVVHESEALPVPADLSWPDAGAIPEAFLTAYDALMLRARLKPGERVLLHAAASGVGTAAIQLAREAGATVLGTTRTPAKLDALRGLGLSVGIDASRGFFRDQVTAPVEVIVDVLGGPALADNLAVLAPGGRLVVLGLLQGPLASQVDLTPVLRRRLTIIGSVMRTRTLEERAALVAEFQAKVLPLFGRHVATEEPLRSADRPAWRDSRYRPVVHAVFPMSEIAAAHREMERNSGVGKIVLVW
ncbi:MAG: NAD(P)H-quinone oxidoreductase [Gemmatimonadales bacterium]